MGAREQIITALSRGQILKPLPSDFAGMWGCFPLYQGEDLVACNERDVSALAIDGLIERVPVVGYVLARKPASTLGTPIESTVPGEASKVDRIFVVCTPKSGSSFMVVLLQHLTGFGHLRPVFGGEPMLEADPYLPLVEASKHPSVSQLHCHAKTKTLTLCERFSIKPIFLTRNIFDSIISMKEYIDNLPHRQEFPDYYELETEDEKRAYIINVYAPIVVRLAAGWHKAWKEQRVPIFWCTYETFFQEPSLHTRRMLQHLGLEYPDEKIQGAIEAAQGEKTATKFNKGVSGRGMLSFAPEEKQRVLDLIASYKGFDAREAGLLA